MLNFQETPGHLFVLATLLPLVSFVLVLLASGLWCVARRYRESSPLAENLYQLAGGDVPTKTPAYIALAAIALAFVCSLVGFILYERDQAHHLHSRHEQQEKVDALEVDLKRTTERKEKEKLAAELKTAEEALATIDKAWENDRDRKWKGTLFELVRVRPASLKDSERGTALTIGFSIDTLAGVMFVMVTLIASLIHLFSIGYMSEEEARITEDHQVHVVGEGHLHRRGRFGRFFMYLSLFCFSMLNLVLADNLFQVFISWELVGICSYLLIGFYYERQSASDAANKAFITNRIGDAGFVLGLLIIWGYIGTFHFEEIFGRVRSPVHDAHGELALAGKVVRGTPEPGDTTKGGKQLKVTMPGQEQGEYAFLFPRDRSGHFDGLGPRGEHVEVGGEEHEAPILEQTAYDNPDKEDYSYMPYWMLVAAGLGIFLGCVGKSAQFPLQVWLPDAMEGPTPVSALIHAATMVAAGVYLVGRCYPLFTTEVLLVIAYTGAITLFVAATIAIVMTDIKKVLAYSTVSQLGYMMLALGVGGWVAGLFHLITHACFKALLFLGSGSVIYGCHHEQEMTKMGGLYNKMKITALTMLAGVLAIAGIPLFSGWYSKDSILAQALGYVTVHRGHALLFLLPLATAGMTTFYMFRMWLLTFTGEPRDEHVHEHAHESPWTMTAPLVVLAVLSVVVGWGWPLLDASASHLEHRMGQSQPVSVLAEFGHLDEHHEHFPDVAAKDVKLNERHHAHEKHVLAGMLALGVVGIGILFALLTYFYRVLDPAEAKEQFPRVYALLVNKWYFDAVYSVLLVRPAMIVAWALRAFDLRGIDGVIHAVARGTVRVAALDRRFDQGFIDWLVNVLGDVTYGIGARMRGVQTGYLRSYVLFLVLAAVGAFVLLSYFVARATAG